MNSRIPGFYKLSPKERLEKVAKKLNLSPEEQRVVAGGGLTLEQANLMIENVIGLLPIPLGVAVNFKVDGRDVFVPMATEEPSVVAAVSNVARLTYDNGGFVTSNTGPVMRGQLQVIDVERPHEAVAQLYERKADILNLCNEQDATLVALGGGAKDFTVAVVEGARGPMVVLHLFVDTRDAMGANAVNTMLEAVAPLVESVVGGQVVLRILTNLADQRLVRARARFQNPFAGDENARHRFLSACELAVVDPYRAATHNKGIMNGISAVALATGNDTRAIEAGAHAYAARSGSYSSLTRWEAADERDIVGTIELPLAAGIIGGATRSHPVARTALKIMDADSAERLASVMAAVGLAQNFAALRALATEGIQKGHMKLHARNLALMAGAKVEEVDDVVAEALQRDRVRFDDMKAIVEARNRG